MKEVSMEEVMKNSKNIYESVVVMFRRARQVTDEQKSEIDKEIGLLPVIDNRESEDFDEVEIDRDALLRDYKKYPKPSYVAMNEMAKGDLDFRYKGSGENARKETASE